MKINNNLVNFIGFQSLWLATVLGAAAGYPAAGLIALAVWLAVHLARIKNNRLAEVRLIGFAAVYGYVADSVLVLSGVLSFPQHAVLGWPSTLWMAVLWAGFATTLRHSLAWMSASLPLAIIFGLLGGPLAYYAGVRLGALQIENNYSFLIIALEWGLSMAVLAGCTRYLGKTAAAMAPGGTAGQA